MVYSVANAINIILNLNLSSLVSKFNILLTVSLTVLYEENHTKEALQLNKIYFCTFPSQYPHIPHAFVMPDNLKRRVN